MRREHTMIPSRAMGREVHCWFYGSFGQPVLVFPSAAGFAHEWESHGMVDALADFVTSGRVKLYTTESNVSRTLNDKQSGLAERLHQFAIFERYVLEDLVPAIRADCNSPNLRIAVTGTSLGGYYAATFALKHPEVFHFALCMSGRYELTQFFGGHSTAEIFYNNPIAFVPGLDGAELERIQRNTHISLVCGRGAYEEGCIEETELLGWLFERKGIPHTTDIWGYDSAHDWDWWKRQARLHFGHAFA